MDRDGYCLGNFSSRRKEVKNFNVKKNNNLREFALFHGQKPHFCLDEVHHFYR